MAPDDVVRAGARRESGTRQRGGAAQRDDMNGERPLLGPFTCFEERLCLLALQLEISHFYV